MSRRDFFQLFCMFYLWLINRKLAKERKHQYLTVYQNWNRTPVYFELAVSDSNGISVKRLVTATAKLFLLSNLKKKKRKTSQAHSLSLKRKQAVPNRRKSPPLLVLPVNLWVNTRHVHLSAHYRKAMMKMLILKVSKSSLSIFGACVPNNNYKLW